MVAEVEQACLIALTERIQCGDFCLERLFGQEFRIGFERFAIDVAFARILFGDILEVVGDEVILNGEERGFGLQEGGEAFGVVSLLAFCWGDRACACDEIVFFEGDVVCGIEVEEDRQCGVACGAVWG